MDDLTILRNLGRALEHEPPASLVRQRQRLLEGARPHRRLPRLMRGWALVGLAAVVTVAAIVVPVLILHPRSAQVAVNQPAPAQPVKELNLLVLGVDRRMPRIVETGPDSPGGARSDTMMLVHLPADRKKVTVVSIPRDTMVQIPACKGLEGESIPTHLGMVNSAFTEGGSPCSKKTMESVTGIRIDHVVEVEFGGLKRMVDALGGVEVTLPQAVRDKASGLDLPAGKHVVEGDQALAYVRVRRMGDGSDIGRIERQQQFLGAMFKKAKSELTDPARLLAFLQASSKTIKTTPELDVQSMVGIAGSLAGVKSRDIRFVTVPWRPYPPDPNRIAFRQPAADKLFASIGGTPPKKAGTKPR
jgi:LCP family protein required for cell wall assembly